MSSSFTPIALSANHGASHMSSGSGIMSVSAWRDHMAEMVTDFIEGRPVYVRYIGRYDPKRKGSIARVKNFRHLDQLINGRVNYYNRASAAVSAIKPPYKASHVKPENMTAGFYPELRWDGRTNKTNPYDYDLEWLKDYDGPTVWKYEIPEEDKVEAVDRLGRELKVGDFICYVLHHFETTGASVRFGNVTKITDTGIVYAKNIKLDSEEYQAEKKINDNSTIVILTKDLMDQLMMAKLSSL